ncbi:succinyl-CoA synthetase-like protein [Xylaria bambusicola]|uniref:succinyl-CoA synthetase-like protein n=1 Tax=Xylaria bambusicola TaxID=326684 RepID=UPI0020082169|nr:succinyl-CoA synthetase-like protein [Xylaria bambusicola]KAI0508493.1 succinyl-CoA synthetase-like protein [Xylaria bambusicola]
MIRSTLYFGPRSRVLRQTRRTTASRSFASSLVRHNYDSTIQNLKIGSHTRVIFQGFTGKQATANAKESLQWGTNIVGGVRPGFEGEHLGLPVLPTVRKAMEVLKPDATGIYVAANQATSAIEEAIEAEVPLVVAVAEHIPLHDMIRIHDMLKTQTKSRLVGANSPGIISATGKCRIGFQPLPCFMPGKVGIVARSGTLSYETAGSTLRSGLGQSICIGVGGDILPGTSLRDGLRVLLEDEDTEAIALVGEIGGEAEIEAAGFIREYRARTEKPKPIAAIIGGIEAVPGRIMGHAGAFALPGEPSAQDKIKALQAANCTIVNHPSRFGPVLKSMLEGVAPSAYGVISPSVGAVFQRRGIHTAARRPNMSSTGDFTQQRRSIYLTQTTAFDLLRQRGIPVTDSNSAPNEGRLLAVTLNRSTRSPCIVASPSTNGGAGNLKRFDYDYTAGAKNIDISAIAQQLELDASNEGINSSLRTIVAGLVTLFVEKEAFLLETRLIASKSSSSDIAIATAHFGFDDAAHRSGNRQADIQALRDTSVEDPAEVEVEKHGIVYVKLPNGGGEGEIANIGTLVNGAGLAMNTVDALAHAGGRAANFLDTGGKATSETVKKSFEVILKDPRVKCILVNIFGGLTLGDMIARGVIMAFRDLNMSVPVVVRIRGSNEKEGQQIIAESGLPLFAFDDFDEAAKKAIELANAAR